MKDPTRGRGAFAFGWERKLRKTDEFSSVFHFRCSGRGKALVVMLAPNGLDFARLGLIVPKKMLPLAVNRNRLRRLLREWFRLRQVELSGLDVIAQVRAPADEATFAAEFIAGLESGRKQALARKLAPAQPE